MTTYLTRLRAGSRRLAPAPHRLCAFIAVVIIVAPAERFGNQRQPQEYEHEGRAWRRRLPQQGPAARTDGDQSVLAALPAARELGLQGSRQTVAQGIHRR